MEEFLMFNNIFSIKNINSSFVNKIINSDKSDDLSHDDYNHILFKCERYEILLNKDNIKPTKEFEQAVEEALSNMKPLKALQDIFNEYGHLFPQRIILGKSLKNILPSSSSPSINNTNLESPIFESLKKFLDILNISYLLTQKGRIVEINGLFDLIQNLDNDLEIVEFDNIISLYEILEERQQRKIDNILDDNYKIIMTGITDLKDLDNNNTEHYKRINIEPSLEDENYEVFGSIISQNNSRSEEFLVKFRLYDFNGFSTMIKTLISTDVDIKECCILWMVIGIPSKLSVFSPKNQDLQVKYKESVVLRPNELNYDIKAPFPLSQGYIISFNAYYSPTAYEPINIKLVEWSKNCIRFQIFESVHDDSANSNNSNFCVISDNDSDYQHDLDNNSSTNIEQVANNINCNICILCSDCKTFRVDYKVEVEEYSLDLIGYKLSEENYNESLSIETSETE